MKILYQVHRIQAPVEKVWQALIDPNTIDKWGGGPAIMSEKQGEESTLCGNEIYGTNIKAAKPYFLEQEWFGGNLDKPSRATLQYQRNSG